MHQIQRCQEYICIFSNLFVLVLMFLPLSRVQQNKEEFISIRVEEYKSSFHVLFQFRNEKDNQFFPPNIQLPCFILKQSRVVLPALILECQNWLYSLVLQILYCVTLLGNKFDNFIYIPTRLFNMSTQIREVGKKAEDVLT